VIGGGRMVRLILTEGEKEYLIKEVAERIKDLIFMDAADKVRKVMDIIMADIEGKDVDPNQEFHIEFCYRLSIGDIVQIVGEYRRRK
jgi:hypothetical protein